MWGGAKPKNVSELAKWCEEHEGGPEPDSDSALEEDEDSADSQIPDAEDSDDGEGHVGKRQRVS